MKNGQYKTSLCIPSTENTLQIILEMFVSYAQNSFLRDSIPAVNISKVKTAIDIQK